jgi:purine-binding chemotaxis protein CheW
MTDSAPRGSRFLIVAVQGGACALPLTHVVETMRPQPIEPIACALSFVRGISILRGVPTPVVDLGALLGTSNGAPARFVTLHLGDRQVALAVDAVVGVREFDTLAIQKLPPLLDAASKETIEAIGTLDEQLLIVLRAGWQLPNAVWQAVAARGVAQ